LNNQDRYQQRKGRESQRTYSATRATDDTVLGLELQIEVRVMEDDKLTFMEIETDEGEITLRNVVALVSDPDMTEMLISKDILGQLGIDVDEIVSSLSVNVFDLQHNGSKYTSLLKKDFLSVPIKKLITPYDLELPSAEDPTDYEMGVTDDVIVGHDDKGALTEALEVMLDQALKGSQRTKRVA